MNTELLRFMTKSDKTWEEITRPLREAATKAGLREEDVPDMIHRMRTKDSLNK